MTGASLKVRIEKRGLTDAVLPILATTGATLEEVASESKEKHVVEARRQIARHLSQIGWSHGSIGALLDRAASTVGRLLSGRRRSGARR